MTNLAISTDQILSSLPHGSGIDADWKVISENDNCIVFGNSFHAMDENGYYCGWMDFKVKLFTHKKDVLNPLTNGNVQVIARKGDIDYKLTFDSSAHYSFSQFKLDSVRELVNDWLQWYFFENKITTPFRNEFLQAV